MALHKDLTGADLHEPKGVSTASSGQVYVADGSGSGSWTTLVYPSVLLPAMTSAGGNIVIAANTPLNTAIQDIIDAIDPTP